MWPVISAHRRAAILHTRHETLQILLIRLPSHPSIQPKTDLWAPFIPSHRLKYFFRSHRDSAASGGLFPPSISDRSLLVPPVTSSLGDLRWVLVQRPLWNALSLVTVWQTVRSSPHMHGFGGTSVWYTLFTDAISWLDGCRKKGIERWKWALLVNAHRKGRER